MKFSVNMCHIKLIARSCTLIIKVLTAPPSFARKGAFVNLYDAIYTRQSVDRADSISVESQIEFCRKEVMSQNFKIYTDKGYSGKNIDRPAFRQLLNDVKNGNVGRVIVYRLDRISRSVLDFANIIDVFQKNKVDFVSTMEKFDTGTPIGKAMLMIVMIFAQLERETIQQRIIDAYASRSKRGFFMGGPVPYGFSLTETTIDGIKTKMFEIIPEEAKIIKLIFSLYSNPQTSFGDVVRYLEEHKIYKRNGTLFNRSRIRDMVTNPIYVKSDYQIYDFFKSQGTTIVNTPEDFASNNGAYLYSGEKSKRKSVSLQGHTLVLAPHQGIVDSGVWLKCRKKCLNNQSVAKPVKAKATWLAGKIKCGKCGYALTAKIYHCKTKADNRYYLCNNKYASGGCNFGSLNADIVDELILQEMRKKLSAFEELSYQNTNVLNTEVIKYKSQIEAIDKEISALFNKIVTANETVMMYINERISELDREKINLQNKIIQCDKPSTVDYGVLKGYFEFWEELTISDKITVVDCLIESIHATKEKIEIKWKI